MASLRWNSAQLTPTTRNMGSWWHVHEDKLVVIIVLSVHTFSGAAWRALLPPAAPFFARLAQRARVGRRMVLAVMIVAEDDLRDFFRRIGDANQVHIFGDDFMLGEHTCFHPIKQAGPVR